jgi:hypothetical protein
LADSIPLPGNNSATNALMAAVLPFGYVDPQSEVVLDGDVADWRIDHIGVDSHALHFHLFNVQVINYVDMAGQVYWPDANQLGWNETVKTEPFTSVFVAMRTKQMNIPWEIPNSIRPMDPTAVLGTVNGPISCVNNPFALQPIVGLTCVPFQQVDPMGNPVTLTNAEVNYGSEYVYHCHLLSHEENDMMRTISFVVAPQNAPGLIRTSNTVMTITDNSYNETGFIVEKSTNGTTWTALPATVQTGTGTTKGSTVGGTTIVAVTAPVNGTTYRATAVNVVGCNVNVPALSDQSLPVTAGPVCSSNAAPPPGLVVPFVGNGWPVMIVNSPYSATLQ